MHLSVYNYVLIENLEISFSQGLTTLTGETGAGKSIILGALGLVLGQRADVNSLFSTDQKCVVESTFNIEGYELEEFFREFDLDYDNNTIIRREILPSGKSRAFINDTPVRLKALKSLGNNLINIHSQHETLTLNNPGFQLAIIDDYAGNRELLKKYQQAYHEFRTAEKELTQLQEKDKSAKAEQDYYQFLFDELNNAKLVSGEKEELEKELEQLNHAEEIKDALYHAADNITRSEADIVSNLKDILSRMNNVSAYHHGISKLVDRLESSMIELEDIGSEIEKLEENTEFDPSRIDSINERLSLIYSLEQKHHTEGIDALLALKDDLNRKLQEINFLDEELEKKRAETETKRQEASSLADNLNERRHQNSKDVSASVENILHKLNMENSTVEVKLLDSDQLHEFGKDRAEILFSANKGKAPGPLNKIASGGELSRLMLSIKSILTDKQILPTIIFDEIDTGVSGNAASRVGDIMADMSRKMQVIALTHLPQIAGKGNQQMKVFKFEKDYKTQTGIKKLNKNERIKEIAMMISGKEDHKEAIKTAEQLIAN